MSTKLPGAGGWVEALEAREGGLEARERFHVSHETQKYLRRENGLGSAEALAGVRSRARTRETALPRFQTHLNRYTIKTYLEALPPKSRASARFQRFQTVGRSDL